MTDLYLVRTEQVPVEQIVEGDTLILPGGRRVTVERVDTYDDCATHIVRWWRPAERGEPGYPRHDIDPEDGCDGRYLGSLIAVPAGHCWEVAR